VFLSEIFILACIYNYCIILKKQGAKVTKKPLPATFIFEIFMDKKNKHHQIYNKKASATGNV
jgi:hypothetical protein